MMEWMETLGVESTPQQRVQTHLEFELYLDIWNKNRLKETLGLPLHQNYAVVVGETAGNMYA